MIYCPTDMFLCVPYVKVLLLSSSVDCARAVWLFRHQVSPLSNVMQRWKNKNCIAVVYSEKENHFQQNSGAFFFLLSTEINLVQGSCFSIYLPLPHTALIYPGFKFHMLIRLCHCGRFCEGVCMKPPAAQCDWDQSAGRLEAKDSSINVKGAGVDIVDDYKYLSIHIDNDLSTFL